MIALGITAIVCLSALAALRMVLQVAAERAREAEASRAALASVERMAALESSVVETREQIQTVARDVIKIGNQITGLRVAGGVR